MVVRPSRTSECMVVRARPVSFVLLLWLASAAAGASDQGANTPATKPAGSTTQATAATSRPAAGGQADPGSQPLWYKQGESPRLLRDDASKVLWKMLASALVILVVGAAALIVTRRLLPRLRAAGGRKISVLETAHIGPRRAVHLVQVGRRQFLLGSTREGIGMLSEVTPSFEKALASHDAGEDGGSPTS